MTGLRSMLRQGGHYALSRVAVMGLGLVSFSIFVRLLPLADYGVVTLVLKWVAVGTAAGKLGIQNATLRFHREQALSADPEALRRFNSTTLVTASANAAIVAACWAAAAYYVPPPLLMPEMAAPLMVAAMLIPVRSVQSIVWSILRAEGRSGTVALCDVLIKGMTILCVTAALLGLGRGALPFAMGVVAAELVVVLCAASWWGRAAFAPRQFEWDVMRSAVRYGLPFVGVELTIVALDAVDRELVRHYLGFEALAVYAAAYNLSSHVEEALILPVGLVLTPAYMASWAERGQEATVELLSKALNGYLLVAAGVVALIASVSQELVTVLGSQKLRGSADLMTVLTGGLLLSSLQVFFGAGLLIHKKTATTARLVALSAACGIGLKLVLIPMGGLAGAALASALGSAILAMLIRWRSFEHLRLTADWRAAARAAILAVCVALVVRSVITGFESALAGLLLKSAMVCGLYAAGLWTLDPSVRRELRSLLAGLAHKPAGAAQRA